MSLGVVQRARAKYNHLPPGPERAYHIVNEVAWNLRDDGAGTFYKAGGTTWNNRSIDVIIFKAKPGTDQTKGETYDILEDAEGKAEPQWDRTKPSGYGEVSKWRAAVPPILVPVPEPGPEPEPEPLPPTGDYITRDEFTAYQRQVDQQLAILRSQLHALETRVAVLEAVGPVPGPATTYMLVPDDTAAPIGTSRAFGHAHEFRAAVVPKV